MPHWHRILAFTFLFALTAGARPSQQFHAPDRNGEFIQHLQESSLEENSPAATANQLEAVVAAVTESETFPDPLAFATFTITASSGAGGSISPNGTVTVNGGANQTFTMTPNTGRHVDSVIVDGVNQGPLTSYTFTNVTANHTIRAVFAINTYTIIASAGPHGSINPSGTLTFNYGANRTFNVTPASSYHIDSVIVDGTNQGPLASYTFTNITADHTIRAVFAINQYTITATAGANGTITPSGAVLVNSGSNQSFAITPSTGYHVDSVIVDGTNKGAITSYAFANVTADHTIRTVYAINQYTITASAKANGSISPSGAVSVTYGADQTFTITPNTGYHVDTLLVDGAYQGHPTSYTFTSVASNHTIRVSFAINQYIITSSAGPGGAISPVGLVTANEGSNKLFTLTPDAGYHVDSLIVDGVNQGQLTSYGFTNIISDHTIRAVFAINEYTIMATARIHGSISPAGTVIVSYGSSQSFTMTPNVGYHVDTLLVDGVYQGQLTSYTFANVTSNHTIRVSFAINQYIITSSAGPGGTISPVGLVTANEGSNKSFIVTPDAGYHVDSLIVDGADLGQLTSYAFTNVSSDHTIRAVFAITQYTIAATARANGSISPSGAVSVNYGADQTFVVTPDTGYHVDSMLVDGVYQGPLLSYTFIGVTSNHSIKVDFAINRYVITATSGPNGSISPAGTVTVNYGANRGFSLTPDAGYHVDSLIVDDVDQGRLTSYSFTNITSDHTIRAVFAVNEYTIIASTRGPGSISPSGAVGVSYGMDQTFVVTPDTGYHVDSLLVDGVDQGRMTSYTFTNVTENHRIRAIFAVDQFIITSSAGPNGSINPVGAVMADYGTNKLYAIAPDAGYHVDSLIVDGVDQGQLTSYRFTNIDSDHTIRAVFAINRYTIAASAKGRGSIMPSGAVVVDYGADQSFLAIPETGFHVDSMIVDGIYVGPIASYTFTKVTANHRIHVVFAVDRFVITASAGPNGTITPSGDVVVNYGADQLFTIAPGSGYYVDSLIVDGSYEGHITSFRFLNVTANHTIRAVFAVSQFTISALAGLNGTISPSGTIGLAFGDSQTFTMTPDLGYHVDSLIIDGVPSAGQTSYTFTNVTANHRIRVTFAVDEFTIIASAGPHGSITPNGTLTVRYGANHSFAITPDTGYVVDSVIVDGIDKGRLKSYAFTNITADHTIRAVFAQIQSSITVVTAIDVNGNGIQEGADHLPLPSGVTTKILLMRNGVPYDSATVGDGLGSSYTFYLTVSGIYKLKEEWYTPGWIQTLGGIHTTIISAGNIQDTARYLYFKLITVRGMAFNDQNKNGVRDSGEPGLYGWVIQADGAGGRFRTTDLNGEYELRGLGPGPHTVSESADSTWAQTLPQTGSYTFDARSGEDQAGFDFGNYNARIVNRSVSGIVFADVARDSIMDPPDFGLRNWKVVLRSASMPPVVDTATTDAKGFYIFKDIAPGSYSLNEVRKPRAAQTYPPSGSYQIVVDASGTPVVDRNFGNYRLVTHDTAKAVVTEEIITSRPEKNVLKAFQFSVPQTGPMAAPASIAASAGDSLPEGTVVRSWDGSVSYNVTRPQFFYWIDLNGDLKFGHPCLYIFVDQAAEAETVAAQWWPVIQLPDQNPLEVWSSWDERVVSSDIFYGGYGAGNTPLTHPTFAGVKPSRISPHATSSIVGTSAILIGGKAESSTEFVTWQHDLDSVRSVLIHSNPPAVDSANVFIANDASVDELSSLIHQASSCDTLYLFFSGHGDAYGGGGIVLNGPADSPGRVSLPYADLSKALFDSLSLKRLYVLVDASGSGTAIDDFMKTKKPVVNLVTSTDAVSSARSGLPADTQSTYTKMWERTAFSTGLSPAVNVNWRALNRSLRLSDAILSLSQNPPDTTNAPLFAASVATVAFPDVNVGESTKVQIDVRNFGFIDLEISSVQSSSPEFFIEGPGTGTIVRNASTSFYLVFKPLSEGSKSTTITFFDNGEISYEIIPATGFGVQAFDTIKFRTFTQDSLALKAIRKTPYACKFTATFPNSADWTRSGIFIQFSAPVVITSSDPFTGPPQSADGGRGKSWVLSGTTVPARYPVTINGIAKSKRPVRVAGYTWISDNPSDGGQRLALSPPVPTNQQLLLPMPNAGNMRDAVFQSSSFFTNGLVIGVPLNSPDSKQYGWICIQKSRYLARFFQDKGIRQSGDARQFDIVGIHPFTGEQKNLSPLKYSNHLAGELAALRFNVMASALAMTPPGLGELLYDDSTSNALNGLTFKSIADSAAAMLTFRWGPSWLYARFDSVLTKINQTFSGPMDTISFGTQLRAKGVRSLAGARYVRSSNLPVVRLEPRPGSENIPEQFTLYQNYPNPFNPSTTIEFELDAPSLVTLKVFNILGQNVATLLDRQAMDDGEQQVDFSANGLPSGVYFYRIEVESAPDNENEIPPSYRTSVRKMIYMR